MPEDAMTERNTRLHGNEDSLDDVDTLMADGQNGHQAQDMETGHPSKVGALAESLLAVYSVAHCSS